MKTAQAMKRKTNFDKYLEEQLKDEKFAERFKKAGEAWDVALELAALRKESGLSQKELAKRVGTTQQQISRLESPAHEGHPLSMLRRVAEASTPRSTSNCCAKSKGKLWASPKGICITES